MRGFVDGPDLYLALSPIHGVGVFAARAFAVGDCPDLFAKGDCRPLPKRLTRLGSRYSTWRYSPADWHRMSIGWYLNDSRTPNIDTWMWEVLRPIRKGEELTISYRALKGNERAKRER